ncbi:MAG TPA: preprotein translocase subunit YajC [Dehalococcoidales bacterium]|nr:preprotein translocase subunit YajC [Dehalococcoidales bacterium]
MRKSKILSLGIILALLALTVSLSSCVASSGTTTTSSTSSNLSFVYLLVFIVIIFGFMYFFTIRPQRKKQQDTLKMLQALQKGEKIITNAGIYGTIDTVYEDSFLIKTDSGSTMRVAKWAVVGKQQEDTVAHS